MTPKQENFARLYVETGNASEAYRRAYDTGRMKPETINNNAHMALKNSPAEPWPMITTDLPSRFGNRLPA